MRRHHEMAGLGQRFVGIFSRDRQQRLLGRPRPPIDQIANHAGGGADDGRVRIGGEVAHIGGMPMITAGEAAGFVHPLLHDRPVAIGGQDERVQIDLEPVHDRVVIDPRRQPAGAHQPVAIDAGARRDRAQLLRRIA